MKKILGYSALSLSLGASSGGALFGKAFEVAVDCGHVEIQVSGKKPGHKFIEESAKPPEIKVTPEGIRIKHEQNNSYTTNNCSKIRLTVPEGTSLDISMGAGNLVMESAAALNKSYKISATVGAGNIESGVRDLSTSRFAATVSASNQTSSKQELTVSLGAGNISFRP